jgi:hypothetical protein
MSWQAFEALRDHSASKGATRTVGFVLASHADKWGENIFVSLDRVMAEAKVGRKSAVDGRRWFIEHGEAEPVDRPDGVALMRGRVRVLSMRPLLERAREAEAAEGSDSEPLDKGSHSEPQPKDGSQIEPTGVRSAPRRVRSAPSKGSAGEPETEGDGRETEAEPEDARAGARDGRSPSESDASEKLREKAEVLTELEALLPETRIESARESLERRIGDLRIELGEGVPA